MASGRLYVNVRVLLENWTINNLLGKHKSRPYNPNVATVMYYAGFIENWGRGIGKICSACAAEGLPEPEYTVHPGDIMIKFTAPKDRIVRVTEKVTDRVTDNTGDEASGYKLGTPAMKRGERGRKAHQKDTF